MAYTYVVPSGDSIAVDFSERLPSNTTANIQIDGGPHLHLSTGSHGYYEGIANTFKVESTTSRQFRSVEVRASVVTDQASDDSKMGEYLIAGIQLGDYELVVPFYPSADLGDLISVLSKLEFKSEQSGISVAPRKRHTIQYREPPELVLIDTS